MPIPENALRRYKGARKIASDRKAEAHERLSAQALMDQLEDKHPGIGEAAYQQSQGAGSFFGVVTSLFGKADELLQREVVPGRTVGSVGAEAIDHIGKLSEKVSAEHQAQAEAEQWVLDNVDLRSQILHGDLIIRIRIRKADLERALVYGTPEELLRVVRVFQGNVGDLLKEQWFETS